MNAGSANWNWPEVESILGALAAGASGDTEPVVCGGQAVAFWALRFGLPPVASRDLDLLGDRDDARRAARILGAPVEYPGRYDMTVLSAVVRAVWKGRPLTIEWLSSVPGIETDPESISQRVELESHTHLRVLHPLALVMAKLHAVRFFDQEVRNDEVHLRIAWAAAERWLRELVDNESPRVLRFIHQWQRAARQPGNRRVLSRLELDWKNLVPLEALRRRAGEEELVTRFLSQHWPRLAGE